MNKWIVPGVLIALALVSALWLTGAYNDMVTMDESVNGKWAQVENVYQRRADLIPNLVATVKGYAEHEQETLTAVVEARAKATNTTIDANNMTAEQLQQFQASQDQLSSALSKLMVVVEKYPELKANENFRDLQAQLEGTENRITVERMKFNEEVEILNKKLRRLPYSFLKGMAGVDVRPYFEAEAGAEKAPKVEF